jgi:hypothetical protein
MADRPDAQINPDVVYLQGADSTRRIPTKKLRLVVTEALAHWQKAQGADLDSPLLLDVTYILNLSGLEEGDLWEELTDRFA